MINLITSQLWLQFVACVLLVAMLPSCASRQDQFGHAVMTGNARAAEQFVAPRFARMTITESNGQHSVPIQYAIVQQNKEMASFLLKNDCHTSIGGRNLTYYCARNGYPNMARYFALQGEGSLSDIELARRDRIRSEKASMEGGLIALGLLAALMSRGGGGGGGSCKNCGTTGDFSGNMAYPGFCDRCTSFFAGQR